MPRKLYLRSCSISKFTDMIENLVKTLHSWLSSFPMADKNIAILETIILLSVILLLAILADVASRVILNTVVKEFVKRSKNIWDDAFFKRKVFSRLAHLAPAIVVYLTIDYVVELQSSVNIIKVFVTIYIIIVSLLTIDALIEAMHDIYLKYPISKDKPIKGYVQVLKIFFYFIAFILIIAKLADKDPKVLLAGLGAIAAVLLLIFKDTILGLVASVQISANNMVKPGDWIEMPSRNADGTVLEITLNTVKVQNWDKTISTIPTYSLVTESFHNWKGMEESGGRRIKRSINIDMRSVFFLNSELNEKLKKIQLLEDYITQREEEINIYNEKRNVDASMPVNGRRLTNLGVFRKYMEEYLKQHPKINKEMTFLVRQLQPTETGIPLEIYVFCSDQRWAYYESIQSDIFDHILATIPFFELQIFQNPSGDDFKAFMSK